MKEDISQQLLSLAENQPQTTDGFIRAIFFGYLALISAHSPFIIQKPKKSQIGKKKHIKQSGDYV